MKYARTFASELKHPDFPSQWVDLAIPYGQLKKCLKKVQKELSDLGLGPDTLSVLLEPSSGSPVLLNYKLDATNPNTLRPQLTVNIHTQDDILVDATLSEETRAFLKTLVASHDLPLGPREETTAEPAPPSSPNLPSASPPIRGAASPGGDAHSHFEVPLIYDGEFFNILLNNVIKLDSLQATQERSMSSEIVALGQDIARLSKPTHLAKNDLERWRAIFGLYLDAGVFFSTREEDHGYRDNGLAARQLTWFRSEMQRLDLARGFRLRGSRVALDRFLRLNVDLLRNLHFQEINKLAVTKILKKFDKRTSLAVSKTFPSTAKSGKLLAGALARDICAQISTELVSVVPQVADYLCPVCFTIAYRPIRLSCQHVFCIRCVVKLQRRLEKHCPLCRSDTVMTASPDNLDPKLQRFMKKYFPKESKEKQKANDLERGTEIYGPGYENTECSVM
ncbi:uncharacterized protein DNG_03981 [Cephalotrichum gorgonifer]|uniref:RING-14 protein n=1 Tax=Cephalotrichum gorgonifer TaxID=2041049 RepID=A0AAE8MX47_9PEZI|nr:uncharacterized protein DNG_03981 [Cephalotrichum gorgonifer]